MAKLIDLAKVPGIKGERGTGYENPNGLGEFECGNCFYFDPKSGTCGESHMLKFSKQPRMNGRVKVHPESCCEFVDRVGRKDDDDL